MKIDGTTAREIARLRGIYERQYAAMKQTDSQLRTLVFGYMNKTGMMDNPADVLEMIGHVPQGYLQFKLYQQYYALTDAEAQEIENEASTQNMELNM